MKNMKKQLIMPIVVVLLITVGLCGCFEENNDKKEDDKPSIGFSLIGSWETNPYYYENGTMASKSVVDNSTMWSPFSMTNEQFCLGEENDIYCYDVEFFDNGNRVILSTYYQDAETGLMTQLFVELIRTI